MYYYDGEEFLCAVSQLQSLPLVPHRSSKIYPTIIEGSQTTLQFSNNHDLGISFVPCVKDAGTQKFRRAKEDDKDLVYLVVTANSIASRRSNGTEISHLEKEYLHCIGTSFLCRKFGVWYLSLMNSPDGIPDSDLFISTVKDIKRR